MADIFVSYKKEDQPFAERVIKLLQADGRSVWWDDGITPHQAWDDMIEAEIAAARAVVVLWSPRSCSSEWVRSEAHYAQEHSKLVPVMIESCSLPIAFSLRQAIDLTDGIDPDSLGWSKLRAWLEGMLDGKEPERTLAPAPPFSTSPQAPAQEEPAAKRFALAKWHYAAIAAILLLVSGLGFGFYQRASATVQPDVVIDRFTMPGDGSIPASFATDLNDEMFATFSSSSRITPRIGNGKRVSDAYQVGGRIDADHDTLRLYLQIYAPDLDAPILTTKIERPADSLDRAAMQFGFMVAQVTRCIATASDSNGAQIAKLPLEAAKGWAKFCNWTPDSTANGDVSTLRSVVAAAPDFANGWSNLAEVLYAAARNPNATDRAGMLREAGEAADRAVKLDPTTAKAYMVKSWIALPLVDPSRNDSFPVFRDFAGWQANSDKSLAIRPSDCGCESAQRGFIMMTFGRAKAAVPYFEQEKAQTGDPNSDAHRAFAMALAGRPIEAKQITDQLIKDWTTSPDVELAGWLTAVWRQDWSQAEDVISKMPPGQDTAPMLALLRALKTGNRTSVDAAGAQLKQVVANGGAGWFSATGLALAGMPDDAIDAVSKSLAKDGFSSLMLLYTPPFAQARQTQGFADLVNKVGLPNYWREPGNRPDFCSAADAPALCKTL